MASLGSSITTEANDDDLAATLGDARKVKRWVQEIKFYETKAQQWHERGKKILRRYKDDRSPREQKVPRYNILWSVIESSLPALFGSNPKPDIERRFRDKDNLGRISSLVLERSISYFINEPFGDAVRQAVKDRLLVGRGLVWARYEPHFKDTSEDENEDTSDEGLEVTDDVTETNDGSGDLDDIGGMDEASLGDEEEEGDPEEVSNELVAFDYVHWQDFGHSFGRTWDEVPAAWRKVYLTREELEERFPECGSDIVLDYSPHDLKDNKYDEVEKKATVYEVWDKAAKKVYWVHKDYPSKPLDEKDDPLQLEGFWPFPRPLFATLANDDCLPTPDYIEYQDQANELDELTSRIGAITKCVKIAGVYDKSAAGIERVLAEGVENQLVPVDQWAIFAEKGGMNGVMELLPLDAILQALLGLYEARDKVKGDFYEISGSSDIMRGQSDPDETATAQTIKSQFGTMRLQDKQDQVKRFCKDLVCIGTQIIAQHFSIDTIKKICGVQLLTEAEKKLVQFRMQALQQFAQAQKMQQPQPGQPPAPPMQSPQLPPLPDWLQKSDAEDMDELMENPTWEEVAKLLEDEITLSYKIDIETDSTIKFDQEADKASRIEFLEAVGKFMGAVTQNQNPDLAPLLGKLLEFGVRGFKVGKELETAFDMAIHKLEKDAQGGQKPNPEMMKIQLEQSKATAQNQLEQQRMQADAALEQQKSQAEDKRIQLQAQTDNQQAQFQAHLDQQKMQMEDSFNRYKLQMDNETKIVVAQIAAKSQLQNTALSKGQDPALAESGDNQPSIADLMQTVVGQLKETLGGIQQSHNNVIQSHQQLAQAFAKPKQVMRDENGSIVGIQ